MIPTVKETAEAALDQAPHPIRKAVLNALAVIGWIGLPSTVISTLASLGWVVDVAVWIYRHAGMIQPLLSVLGQGLSLAVGVWRSLTHPVWQALADLLSIALPAWGPDVLTLLALCGLGVVRRSLRAFWGDQLSGILFWVGTDQSRAPFATFVRAPRHFPYRDHFADCGVRWTPRRLRDAERLWRRWRSANIRAVLAADSSRWPRIREDVMRAQFGRYWLAVMAGRRDMRLYWGAAGLALAAFAIDWAYRGAQP